MTDMRMSGKGRTGIAGVRREGSSLWGVSPSLEKVAFFSVSAVNLVERRGNAVAH